MSNISIIAYVVLALSIGYAFVYPSYQDLNSLMDQKTQYEDSLTMVDKIQSKETQLQTQFSQISDTDKKNIDTVLPSSFNFVQLVSQISVVAANYGISISQISSKMVDPSVGDSVSTAAPSNPYNSAIIGFSFDTSYQNYRAFLRDLERSQRILDIRSASIQAQNDGTYLFTVEFETYWLK